MVNTPRRAQSSQRSGLTPGVRWWGAPAAVVLAVWMHGRSAGYSWRALFSIEFLVWLVVFLVSVGWFGGRAFERTMERLGHPLGRGRPDRDRPS